ncbi:MAG: dTMP kinase [Candidatus Nanoarchaeia archaeon]|nr:dTMP kinase [Candidatus Nanoarchaeia archaeon]MDD5741629.1 dTMP kinase [Candidatus Nanoarchaeia archaeon]
MFIVFEGIDGCGKSTQILKLVNYFYNLDKHNHILLTREPYKEREIRKILKSEQDPYSQKEKLTELYVNDRKEHIKNLITPSLEKNMIVISDRYKYSTICYQSVQGQDVKGLMKMHENMPIPNFVFIINTSVKTASIRMHGDSRDEHKFEKNKEFLEKVRQNYLKMKEIFPNEKIIIINGEKPIEEIFKEIKKYFPKPL